MAIHVHLCVSSSTLLPAPIRLPAKRLRRSRLSCFETDLSNISHTTGLLALPAELSAAATIIAYWDSSISVGVWITVGLVFVIGIQCMGTKAYGETEFWCIYYAALAYLPSRSTTDPPGFPHFAGSPSSRYSPFSDSSFSVSSLMPEEDPTTNPSDSATVRVPASASQRLAANLSLCRAQPWSVRAVLGNSWCHRTFPRFLVRSHPGSFRESSSQRPYHDLAPPSGCFSDKLLTMPLAVIHWNRDRCYCCWRSSQPQENFALRHQEGLHSNCACCLPSLYKPRLPFCFPLCIRLHNTSHFTSLANV